MRKAKILATLGPSSNTRETIEKMIHAGLNAVRINMSHGEYETHEQTLHIARETAESLGKPLSVLVDLAGPKIRTKLMKDGLPAELKAGQQFVITTRDVLGDEHEVATNFDHLPDVVEPGAASCSMTAP